MDGVPFFLLYGLYGKVSVALENTGFACTLSVSIFSFTNGSFFVNTLLRAVTGKRAVCTNNRRFLIR